MRREWLMFLLVVVLLVPVGCGTTAQADADTSAVGSSDRETYTIQVKPGLNQPPKAVISTLPTSSEAGETVSFSAAGSTDPDGYIKKYEWDFGDETTEEGVNVTHVYAAPGTYKVTLTVTDNGGATDIVAATDSGEATVLGAQQSSPITDGYVVQSGDCLMGISRKLFNGDPQYWDEIAALNGIKAPYIIYPGQQLKVPQK
jgi:PKD repeat protein